LTEWGGGAKRAKGEIGEIVVKLRKKRKKAHRGGGKVKLVRSKGDRPLRKRKETSYGGEFYKKEEGKGCQKKNPTD